MPYHHWRIREIKLVNDSLKSYQFLVRFLELFRVACESRKYIWKMLSSQEQNDIVTLRPCNYEKRYNYKTEIYFIDFIIWK